MSSKPIQATEVFRFICARPAIKAVRPLLVRRTWLDEVTDPGTTERPDADDNPDDGSEHDRIDVFTASLGQLKYADDVTKLGTALGLPSVLDTEVGLATPLDTQKVRDSVHAVFGAEDGLAELIAGDLWQRDEQLLDHVLVTIYKAAADPQGIGPSATRQRQLYDLVEQVALSVATTAVTPAREGMVQNEPQDDKPFSLRGMQLTELLRPERTLAPTPARLPGGTGLRTLAGDTSTEDDKDKNFMAFMEALRLLNSSAIVSFRKPDLGKYSEFAILPSWLDLLSSDAHDIVKTAVQDPRPDAADAGSSVSFVYDMVMKGIRGELAAASKVVKFKSGVFFIGPFSLEMTKPWTLTVGAAGVGDGSDGVIPEEKPSMVKPTGVADLLVVRDHLYEYIGGDIGAIQNVLKSESLTRETKQLDRTEVVDFTSSETQTANEQEQSTNTRFALSKESNDVIKKDASLKVGVSTTAYGPSVTVKGDLSYAQNSSSESANKVASQYSQDVTSRATSKIIEKTFNSTSQTTISQFEERNRHVFDNSEATSANISGVYQWVNKVSQCQMYNYGKRLLIDITVPEPAAFLMTRGADAGPSVEKPEPLTESAADLHEGNYSAIAARYQATGVKPPGDLLTSFSQSFKAEIAGASDQPKADQGNAFLYGGHAAVNLDVKIPEGYLAYSAKIQVGVRTGPTITGWGPTDKTGDHLYPFNHEPRAPMTHVTVAGMVVMPGTVTYLDTMPMPAATDAERLAAEAAAAAMQLTGNLELKQDTRGTVFFTEPLLGGTIAVSVAQDFCLALSGTIMVNCIRDPSAYATWQQTTYDSIQAAYTRAKTDYEQARAEAAVSSSMSVVTGSNPLENAAMIATELKKAAIEFMTDQHFKIFGSVAADPEDGLPEITDFEKAMQQGTYAGFLEKAFEWENMTYELFPYFWARRATWRERVGFRSADPTFSAFVKAGMAKVTVPARLGFGLEVIHFLQTGRIWGEGPVLNLNNSPYYSLAQEIVAAEANPEEVKVSKPWYTVIPTDLVRLRADSVLPRFRFDAAKQVWVEREAGDLTDD